MINKPQNELYLFNKNPFQDTLIAFMLNNQDLADNQVVSEIHGIFVEILENCLEKAKDCVFLDFRIKHRDGHYKLVANNLVTALWFELIFPENVQFIMLKEKYVTKEGEYTLVKNKLNFRKK